MPHLFVDISSHGFGHLAQTGPVLDALATHLPDLRLTIRSGLPAEKLQQRIAVPFDPIEQASDVAFLMHDATRVDREGSAAAWRGAHAGWPAAVAADAELLSRLAPDLVLANVSPRPLAAAKAAGIPAVAMCSLNWAEQFGWLFAGEAWAAPILKQLQAAYGEADAFLRLTPAMPMPALDNSVDLPPVARIGKADRAALAAALGAGDEKLVLVAMGGIGFDLPVARWPRQAGIRWLVGDPLAEPRTDVSDYRRLGWNFADLLASVDAVVTKPGYGMFVESAASGIPLLYLRREDWLEQEALIDWLAATAICAELSAEEFARGDLVPKLSELWRRPRKRITANGAEAAAAWLAARLRPERRSA